jgi:hypothetical protein
MKTISNKSGEKRNEMGIEMAKENGVNEEIEWRRENK